MAPSSSMIHPFQCILLCTLASESKPGILLAAFKSKIFVFSVANGRLLSIWQDAFSQTTDSPLKTHPTANATYSESHDPSERPAKRQRRSSLGKESDSSSAEIVIEEDQLKRQGSSKPSTNDSNVIKLAIASDSCHIVAVTDEDKSIRVLQLGDDGVLQQLSKRSMPKRPCAIAFTPDQETILCGDKFGDVYALPLLPNLSEKAPISFCVDSMTEGNTPSVEANHAPSASLRTVHTLKNRKALKHQLNSKSKKAPQKIIDFEHQLLLGHVSLLTDIICVSLNRQDVPNSNQRTYIITSDRDEHIRISRGMPQAHIIEGFCLGHTQFVSKLCVPCWDHQMLISGGGDDHLLVWNWPLGHIECTVDVRKWVSDHIDQRYACSDLVDHEAIGCDEVHTEHAKIAISDIHSIETVTVAGEVQRRIVVAVEGYVDS